MTRRIASACTLLLLSSCGGSNPSGGGKLTVAAAANLSGVIEEIGAAFHKETGVSVTVSYGSTAQLTQQILNGAPFDVFAAADMEHIDKLVAAGKLIADSRAVYASGQLALWVPEGRKTGVNGIADLADPGIRSIAIAQPALAPYGAASVETLRRAGLWVVLQPKVVYAQNINMARQFAATGNADVAFTAYSLVQKEKGTVIKIDPKLHGVISQGLGIVASSQRLSTARQFRTVVLGPIGQAILGKAGYLIP